MYACTMVSVFSSQLSHHVPVAEFVFFELFSVSLINYSISKNMLLLLLFLAVKTLHASSDSVWRFSSLILTVEK